MLKQIAVSELTPGMMVTRVVEQSGPVKIRKVGFIRSPDMIKGLKEMGVTLVEVNLDESLNVEFEAETLDSSEVVGNKTEAVSTKTATQRLVASNKQIADVDRQLSQQFHRSLFLPAVDQMPSKWTLYGKPYALLVAYVVVGLLIGSVSTYTIQSLSTSSQLIVYEPQKLGAAFDSSPSMEVASEQINSDNASSRIEDNPTGGENITDEGVVADTDSKAIIAAQLTDDLNNANVLPQQEPLTENKVNSATVAESVNEQSLVNGVLLEEGQQLLGYQGTDDAISESSNNNASQNSSAQSNNTNIVDSGQSIDEEAIINSELFRRIQRVAEDVDNQPTEPAPELLRVTDLNELPRIDQLSPAILTQMPAMSFSAHMYASNPQDRWVRVNSTRLGEGDTIANKVLLKRIESEKVVLEYKGTEFTMNALSDW
jgi:general secretion pathway protein B